MLGNLVKKFVGSSNDRMVKRLAKEVERINQPEEALAALSDEELAAKTPEFRQRLEEGALSLIHI